MYCEKNFQQLNKNDLIKLDHFPKVWGPPKNEPPASLWFWRKKHVWCWSIKSHYDSQEKGQTKDNKKNPSTILVSQKPSFASVVSYPKYSIYKVCLLTELGSLGV